MGCPHRQTAFQSFPQTADMPVEASTAGVCLVLDRIVCSSVLQTYTGQTLTGVCNLREDTVRHHQYMGLQHSPLAVQLKL